MTAAHVRRGGAGRAKPRKSGGKVAAPKKIGKRLPVVQAHANKVAGLVFAAFMLAVVVVVLLALDIPAKAERSAASAVGHAGFTVSGYQIVGLNHMARAQVDQVVTDELHRAAEQTDSSQAPQAMVDAAAIRTRLLQFGWVKDARVLRRLPDMLVIDIVERKPAALWQSSGELALIELSRSGAGSGAGKQNARPSAVDRPRRECPGGGAFRGDGRGPDAETAACLRDLGRWPPLGPELPVR